MLINIYNRLEKTTTSLFSKIEHCTLFTSNKRPYSLLVWSGVVLFFFTIILILNAYTPLTADDYGYSYVHGEDSPIISIRDILTSQINHYKLWGGRSVVHAIAESLLLLPPLVADILNSLVYIIYVSLIYFIIKGKNKHSLSLYLLVNLSVWFIQPAFGDTILWITGSANYLWGTTIILSFLLPFRLYSGSEKSSKLKQIPLSIGFFAFSIIAGWTNENTAGGMIVIAILSCIYFRSQNWKIPYWSISGILGAIIGFIIMIKAPGNAIRAGEAGELSLFIITHRFFTHTSALFLQYGMFIISYGTLLIINNKRRNKSTEFSISLIYLIGTLGSIYAMLFSPSFPDRAWFGILTYFTIALGILFQSLIVRRVIYYQIKQSMLIVGLITFFFMSYYAGKDVYSFYCSYQNRQLLITKAKANKEKKAEFNRYVAKTKFVHTEEPLSKYMMSRYYGIEIDFLNGKKEDSY